MDTHIHGTSSFNQKHLLRFIKKKLKKYPHDKVYQAPDGHIMTLEVNIKTISYFPDEAVKGKKYIILIHWSRILSKKFEGKVDTRVCKIGNGRRNFPLLLFNSLSC